MTHKPLLMVPAAVNGYFHVTVTSSETRRALQVGRTVTVHSTDKTWFIAKCRRNGVVLTESATA